MDVKEKMKNISQMMKGINKKFGENTIMLASEAEEQGLLTKRRIKTPSLEFNEMLNGGFGGIIELFGPTGSGKTSLAIETIAYNQKIDPDFVAAWLETEGSVTDEILKLHGVDLNRLVYWTQESVGNAESALDIARALFIGNNIDFMAVNSVAGLAPKAEIEDDLEKQNIALTARTLSKFFRVSNNDISKYKVTVVFINQIRDAVGSYGNPVTTTGGKALSFYASQRVFMNNNKIDASDPISKEEGLKIGCSSKKNRFCGIKGPYTKCAYYATYEHGIDTIVAIPQKLISKGVISQSGAWLSYLENGQVATIESIQCKWQGKANFIKDLRENEKLREFFLSKLEGEMSQAQTAEEVAASKAEEERIRQEGMKIEKELEAEEINDILKENS